MRDWFFFPAWDYVKFMLAKQANDSNPIHPTVKVIFDKEFPSNKLRTKKDNCYEIIRMEEEKEFLGRTRKSFFEKRAVI